MSTQQRPMHVNELTTQLMAAELNLTLFASRFGKESTEYQEALNDFATAWYLLRKNRPSEAFLKEVTRQK